MFGRRKHNRTTIQVRDFKVLASIGIYPHEHERQQQITVNVDMELIDPVVPHDRIDDTVSYEGMVSEIRAQAITHHNLVETLAEDLASYALKDRRIAHVRVQILKNQVYDEGSVGCDILRSR